MSTINNSTISNTTFSKTVLKLEVSNATVDRCKFQGLINNATLSGIITKSQFEGLSSGINVKGTINDMTIQVDVDPTSAYYVQNTDVLTLLINILLLAIDPTIVPRLTETLHKECFVNIIKPDNKKVFIVQLVTDDTNPSGVIIMFYPGTIPPDKTLADMIPKGYALCDGTNGTPDLRGRFIRSAYDKNDIGKKDNTGLVQGSSGRTDSIKIKAENLPPHRHYYSLTNITVDNNLEVSLYTGYASDTYSYSYGCSGSEIGTGDKGTATIPGVCSDSGNISVSLNHSHNLTGTITFSADVTLDLTQETFDNSGINIEPNAYALVFIMKL